MKIQIEIPEEELKKAVLDVVSQQYYKNYSMDRRNVNKTVAQCVREIIYSDKERIIAQASTERMSKQGCEEDSVIEEDSGREEDFERTVEVEVDE